MLRAALHVGDRLLFYRIAFHVPGVSACGSCAEVCRALAATCARGALGLCFYRTVLFKGDVCCMIAYVPTPCTSKAASARISGLSSPPPRLEPGALAFPRILAHGRTGTSLAEEAAGGTMPQCRSVLRVCGGGRPARLGCRATEIAAAGRCWPSAVVQAPHSTTSSSILDRSSRKETSAEARELSPAHTPWSLMSGLREASLQSGGVTIHHGGVSHHHAGSLIHDGGCQRGRWSQGEGRWSNGELLRRADKLYGAC